MSLEYKFKYGWCHTDSKEGYEIEKLARNNDYVFGAKYEDSVGSMLEALGLPIPGKFDVYRGTYHDILFLDSHGLVVKIGPADMEDLLNPLILQPIGWLQDNSIKPIFHVAEEAAYPLTVAVYPGIEILKHVYDEETEKFVIGFIVNSMRAGMAQSGQFNEDVRKHNLGIVRIEDKGEERAVPIMLDVDNMHNSSEPHIRRYRIEIMDKYSKEFNNKADVLGNSLVKMFGMFDLMKDNLRAFEVHQSLRRTFWEACNNPENTDKSMLKGLWNNCAGLVDNHTSAQFPVWKEKDGKFIKSEVYVPNMVLHTPWTGAHPKKNKKATLGL